MDHRAFVDDDQIGRSRPNVHQADAQFAFIGSKHSIGIRQRLEDCVVDLNTAAIDGAYHVLRSRRRRGHDVHANFQLGGHHPQRLMDARLFIENEFLRKQVQNLAIGRQCHGSCAIDGSTDVFAGNFASTRSPGDTALAVRPANVSSGNPITARSTGAPADIFGLLDCFLNRRNRLFQIDDDSLSGAARLRRNPCPRYLNPVSVISAVSAHVFALPTSMAVNKVWFTLLMNLAELHYFVFGFGLCFGAHLCFARAGFLRRRSGRGVADAGLTFG